MALETGAAADLPGALRLTPNQVVTIGGAVARMRSGTPKPRRATPADFKAALLGALG